MNARMKWIAGASAAVVLAAAASVAVIALGQSGSPSAQNASATATPTPIPTVVPPTTGPSAPAAAVEDAFEDLVSSVLDVTTTVNAGDIDVVLDSLKAVAAPIYLSGVEAERMELEDQGWTRSGQATVDGVETLEYDASKTPATASIRACIDSSDVVIHDAAGDVVTGGSPRAWKIFAIEQVDGAWKIIGQTFADDPAC